METIKPLEVPSELLETKRELERAIGLMCRIPPEMLERCSRPATVSLSGARFGKTLAAEKVEMAARERGMTVVRMEPK